MSMDLNIRVKSELGTTQQVLIYQKAIALNVKNFKTAAWEHRHLAPGAVMKTILPTQITMGSLEEIGNSGTITSKLFRVDYNTAWDMFDNNNALDVRKSNEPAPAENTIEIHNKCKKTTRAIIAKDDRPLFSCDVRPDFKVNFCIHPKIFVALSDLEITDPFFDAATLSKTPLEIEYEGQQYLTIILKENQSTGVVDISYDFGKFVD